MEKILVSTLIGLFILCGLYALYDKISGQLQINTSDVMIIQSVKSKVLIKQKCKENIQALDSFPYDYKIINNKAIFLPTWDNVFNAVVLSNYQFKEVMAIYDYEYDIENNSWFKEIKEIKSEFTVSREKEGSLLLLWENIELSTKALENRLQEELILVQKDKFIQIYEIKKEGFVIRISIAKTGASNFVAFDIIKQ